METEIITAEQNRNVISHKHHPTFRCLPPGKTRVTKKNGKVTHFSANKIYIAKLGISRQQTLLH